MALILSIESSTTACSVAIHEKGGLLGIMELHQDNVHGQKLLLLVKDLMERIGLKSSDLQAVAVSSGPGSYTGLRIGVSIAKGLAFAHHIPLIGVDTLAALAYQVRPFIQDNDLIIPMMDARRMEVYMAVYDAMFKEIEPVQPRVIESNPFLDYLKERRVFYIGDGVNKMKEVLSHPNSVFLEKLNSSLTVGELAYKKFEQKLFEDIAYFEPNYLKEFRVIASKKNPFLV
ncbi:tRNA (adenosine(37)-N6)-threonylcarbamoyltransferase complex dimerization subunit type 1 TsaB [Shivajiella indica]|uniref:tRNA (Adenosine(37)-N6)-threonylcarbamoyltransferase complex dimerization subunit type 1 TsaB n=1 Tax=Shivajiella indica TaxID=872115 RepID=A0ABW5B6K0_9BACT